MKELGQWLREAREEKGLSLAEVESQTRIRQKFLAALEAEDWDGLPGDVTTRGFLRNYATFLGIDVKAVMEQYQQRASGPAAVTDIVDGETPGRRVDYRPIEVELPEVQTALRFPWRAIALLALVLLLAAAGLWVYFYRPTWINSLTALLPQQMPNPGNLLGADATPEPTPTRIIIRVTATATDTPEVTPTSPATQTPEATPVGSGPATDETASPDPGVAAVAGRLLVQVDVVQRAWIRAIVDGQTRLEAIIEPGEILAWEGQQFIILRTGNAEGIIVTLNDETLPPLGGAGEVVEFHWVLEDGRIYEVTPTPTPTETPEAAAAESSPEGEADTSEGEPSALTDTPTPEPGTTATPTAEAAG